MQKRHRWLLALLVIAAALVIWWWWRPGSEPSGERPAESSGQERAAQRPAPAAESAHSPGSGGESRVRRLSVEERRALGEKIAQAIQRARSTSASSQAAGGGSTTEEEPTIPLEEVARPLQDALRESIPLLAECYRDKNVTAAAALMTMASDPELGTVIDTEHITDVDGKTVDAALDECLRDTIDSLALPPLGATGKLKLQYTFRFD